MDKIRDLVRCNRLLIIRCDKETSGNVYFNDERKNKFTLARKHSLTSGLVCPSLALMELDVEGEGVRCFFAIVSKKQAVSSFETRITIRKMQAIELPSVAVIPTDDLKDNDRAKIEGNDEIQVLSKNASEYVINFLAQNQKNKEVLAFLSKTINEFGKNNHIEWAQDNAIHSAMMIFGLSKGDAADEIIMQNHKDTELLNYAQSPERIRVYEDNAIAVDASRFLDFTFLERDISGKAFFQKGDQKLTVYTANRFDLEQALGVDLIYVNETMGSIVMMQYKMLEAEGDDWIYRPDDNFEREVGKMQLPIIQSDDTTYYRIYDNPFFLKFVRRNVEKNDHRSFIISLEHWKKYKHSPEALGKRDGLRISYKALGGCYLRETDFNGLVRSGYVGCSKELSNNLLPIIESICNGNRALVLAWQEKSNEWA